MFNFDELVKEQEKGQVVSSIVEETQETQEAPENSGEGQTREGRRFLALYEARVLQGKAFSRAGASLRQAKSEETVAFWGKYAILSSGFGGVESYKAPPYEEAALRERLKILGWKQKRLPSAFAAYCRKHKLSLSPFQAACVLQEEASRKAARREDELEILFPDSLLDFFVSRLRGDDSLPLDKVLTALSKAVKERLIQDGAK